MYFKNLFFYILILGDGGTGTTVLEILDTKIDDKNGKFVVSRPFTDYEFSSIKDISYTCLIFVESEVNLILKKPNSQLAKIRRQTKSCVKSEENNFHNKN